MLAVLPVPQLIRITKFMHSTYAALFYISALHQLRANSFALLLWRKSVNCVDNSYGLRGAGGEMD